MISGSGWSTALYGLLTGIGFQGSNLHDLTDAVGLGSASHVVGKAFATIDVGTIPGVGVGVGVGVTGLSASTISSQIFSACVEAFGQSGTQLQPLCDQIGAACVSQMALATLTSAHTTVYVGVGTITPGSITVVPSAWGSAIFSQAAGFSGSQWLNLATAIGKGMGQNVSTSGTGTVSISGSPTGGPTPGGGSGTGTIS